MLFDEPTSNLDAEMVHDVLSVMRDLVSERMTMVVITHENSFAREVAHRVLMFDGGRIVEDRPPSEFFDWLRHERTKRFLSRVL